MADTTFVNGTVIEADWLNDVNDSTYGPTAPTTTLRGQLNDSTSSSNGDALIAVKSTATGSVATTQHEVNERTKSAFDFMTAAQRADVIARTLTLDVTSALQAWIDSLDDKATGVLPAGAYLISDTLTVSQNRVHLKGAGSWATEFRFQPTANAACLELTAGASVLFQGSVSGISFYSTDSTYEKIAIDMLDTSGYLIDDIVVGGSVVAVPGSTFWSGGAGGSIALRTQGREACVLSRLYMYADRPIVIAVNPNNSISIDHFHFTDLYLAASDYPCITVDTGVNLTQVTFDGYQIWAVGTYGFYWNDTTTVGVSIGLHFNHVRTEQGTDNTAWQFYISHNYGLQNVTFDQIYGGSDRNGYYLRKCENVSINDSQYVGTTYVGLNADATVKGLRGRNTFWQAGSTATLAGQRPITLSPKSPSTGALPPDFDYQESVINNRTLRTGLSIFGSNAADGTPVSMTSGSTQIVASNNATGQLFISTQENFTAVFNLNGTDHTTTERDDAAGVFSTTAGTATSYNVYHDGSNYVIQNNRASTWRVGWLLIGSDTAI